MRNPQPTDKDYIRNIVQQEIHYATPSVGVVQDVYEVSGDGALSSYEVDVEIIGSDMTGNGQTHSGVPVSAPMSGAASGLQRDSMVLVQYLEGQSDTPMVTDVLYDDDNRSPQIEEDEFRLRLGDDAVIEVSQKESGRMINIGQQPDDGGDIETGLSLNLSDGSFSLLDAEGKGIAFDGDGNGIIDWESMAQPWGAAGPVNWDDEAMAGDSVEFYEHQVTVVDSNGEPIEGVNVSVEEISSGDGGDSGDETGGEAPDAPIREEVTEDEETLETQIADKVNTARSDDGVATLTYDSELANVARWHSAHLAETDSSGHEDEYFGTNSDRLDAAGIEWESTAENVATGPGYDTLDATSDFYVNEWIDSPGHAENIFSEVYENHGVGVHLTQNENGDDLFYGTHIFVTYPSEGGTQ